MMNTCPHLAEYKEHKGSCTYRIIHAFFVVCVTKSSRQRKAIECLCHICKSRSKKIHACLSCVFFGCFTEHHIQQHAAETQHHFAVDTTFGNVYCSQCCDYVYDKEFEAISRKHKLQVACPLAGLDSSNMLESSQKDVDLLFDNCDVRVLVEESYLGLRGLVNLGNTCFMSCILQALVHTPLLRSYFLGDKHVCHFQDEPSMCLVCEMSSLFQEFYSGQSIPYIPFRLLYLVWTHAEHLSGYFQQDAHEFFIVFLNILHLHSKGTNAVHAKNDHICNCIIDRIFTGFLQSELVCGTCNHISTTIDPFKGISLDLGSNSGNFPYSEIANSSSNSSEPMSLFDCLERFTQPESLGGTSCENCYSFQSSTKQFTLQKLPCVISFHFKRLSGKGKKNRNFISFPEFLDLTPFISSVRSRASGKPGESVNNCMSHSDNKFYLYGVVNHVGDVSGHYYSFVRQYKSKWYRCDDHLVTKASIQEVLSSEAYLLFYHKQQVDYELCADDVS